jgi:hypothetical protein
MNRSKNFDDSKDEEPKELKISQLIIMLQGILDECGDFRVCVWDRQSGSFLFVSDAIYEHIAGVCEIVLN